jgi:hypothetical protein
MPSSPPSARTSMSSSPAPLLNQVATRYQLDPSQVQTALQECDEFLVRRAARRQAAARDSWSSCTPRMVRRSTRSAWTSRPSWPAPRNATTV